jgi:hypothetical protein
VYRHCVREKHVNGLNLTKQFSHLEFLVIYFLKLLPPSTTYVHTYIQLQHAPHTLTQFPAHFLTEKAVERKYKAFFIRSKTRVQLNLYYFCPVHAFKFQVALTFTYVISVLTAQSPVRRFSIMG